MLRRRVSSRGRVRLGCLKNDNASVTINSDMLPPCCYEAAGADHHRYRPGSGKQGDMTDRAACVKRDTTAGRPVVG